MLPLLPAIALLAALLALAGCSGEIYLRDGVTDGDTFYLAERALSDDDPVLQSWVAYSLALSVCKLNLDGENPARASSFDCELEARRQLADRWRDLGRARDDDYLDALVRTDDAGLLPEYVAHYLRRPDWTLPGDLERQRFAAFRRDTLAGHRPETRIIGSWNYARKVRAAH